MLFNITLFILALIAMNAIVFFVANVVPKIKQSKQEKLKHTEQQTIKLNQKVQVETSQELAPTGS